MTLAKFIRDNHPVIAAEWERFASTLHPAAGNMTKIALRDHVDEILTAVVTDMEQPQDRNEQADKSKGDGDRHRMEAVGQIHASLRVEGGFKLEQLVAEYRALRGSVLRLWGKSGAGDLEEVTRFNEAIDEALTEAAITYSKTIEQTRDQFLAILGHDLRNPLAGITLAAAAMRKTAGPEHAQAKTALRIMKSAGRMERMVNDLLDLTRTRLGSGIPITQTAMDLNPLLAEVLGEFKDSHPDGDVRCEMKGDLRGDWDRDRIAQVISNLVGNALQHGDGTTPVALLAQGGEKDVVVEINNQGVLIPPAHMGTIFEPMVRHDGDHSSTSLGLGLYIAREIATAHGGNIEASSIRGKGTTFTLSLPRHR